MTDDDHGDVDDAALGGSGPPAIWDEATDALPGHGPDRRDRVAALGRLDRGLRGALRQAVRARADRPADRGGARPGGGPRRGRGHPHRQRRGPGGLRRGPHPQGAARRDGLAVLGRAGRQPLLASPSAEQTPARARARSLLQRSRDVWSDEEAHPAYARILGELAPDEARILLLLLRGGPQPSVDVRTGGPVGLVSSALVAPGMTMIGARAGCRYLDEVPAYLNNLFRLGLIWFSREQLEDPMEYQVVEAQPDVLEAMHSVRFPKVVRRSIHLTPFGTGFCQACLVDSEETDDAPGAPDPGGVGARARGTLGMPGPPGPEVGPVGARTSVQRRKKPVTSGWPS